MAFLLRHIRAAVLACVLSLAVLPAFLMVQASPAYAHDTLKSSTPAKDADVSSVEEIELEYSAGVKFPFVVLHDAAGKEIPLGKPRLDGPKVRTGLARPLTPGRYTIGWRVVSSDGHPIEGEIPFSVKGSASPSASSSPAGAGPATGEAPSPGASQAAGERPAVSAGVPGWIWGGLAVLVVLGAFVLLRTARRGPDREDVDAG
ncbi:copper resistance CopC family protein [Nonomuraea sp. NPDC002799]